jgi:putative spermidine/putrescine transport system permease protein
MSGRGLFLGAVMLFLAGPLLVVAGVSLNAQRQLLFPPRGLSLRWYLELFQEADWLNALSNSLIIAVTSAALAVSIAFPLAWFLWRYRVGYAKALWAVGVAPFTLPPVVTASWRSGSASASTAPCRRPSSATRSSSSPCRW